MVARDTTPCIHHASNRSQHTMDRVYYQPVATDAASATAVRGWCVGLSSCHIAYWLRTYCRLYFACWDDSSMEPSSLVSIYLSCYELWYCTSFEILCLHWVWVKEILSSTNFERKKCFDEVLNEEYIICFPLVAWVSNINCNYKKAYLDPYLFSLLIIFLKTNAITS